VRGVFGRRTARLPEICPLQKKTARLLLIRPPARKPPACQKSARQKTARPLEYRTLSSKPPAF
jgi:hypothetical protein